MKKKIVMSILQSRKLLFQIKYFKKKKEIYEINNLKKSLKNCYSFYF